jgi:hypothetical protein
MNRRLGITILRFSDGGFKGYECVMRAVEFYICEYEETQPQLSRGGVRNRRRVVLILKQVIYLLVKFQLSKPKFLHKNNCSGIPS